MLWGRLHTLCSFLLIVSDTTEYRLDTLAWPRQKEDLERYYLQQVFSTEDDYCLENTLWDKVRTIVHDASYNNPLTAISLITWPVVFQFHKLLKLLAKISNLIYLIGQLSRSHFLLWPN